MRDAILRPECAVIVGIVAELGRRLGIAVVAEGVETADHLDLAIREGCHEVQGYLIGYPAAVSAGMSRASNGDVPAPAGQTRLSRKAQHQSTMPKSRHGFWTTSSAI